MQYACKYVYVRSNRRFRLVTLSDVSDAKEELAAMKRVIRNTLGEKVLASLEAVIKRELDKRKQMEAPKQGRT